MSSNGNYGTPPVVAVPYVPAAGTGNDTVKTYLALGDSYTIGQSVDEADKFPVQTVKLLNDQQIKFYPPEIIAQTGWTTGNLISALNTTAPSRKTYTIVTLLIGVNNQYQHLSKNQYAVELDTLIARSVRYAANVKNHVIVLSIPDYSVTPFAAGSDRDALAKDIDAFNDINKEGAAKNGVNYLDITGFTRLAKSNPSLIAPDGLHPSGPEYSYWANALTPVIKQALQ